MMICPQCKTIYEDDCLFCLSDGNALIDDGAEQQTVLNQKPRLAATRIASCLACGESNKANSKFCKKCGAGVPQTISSQTFFPGYVGDRPVTPSGSSYNQPNGETVAFVPPMFTPPVQPVADVQSRNNNVLLITLAGALILALAGILFMMINSGGVVRTDDDQRTRSNNVSNENSNSASVTATPSGVNNISAKSTVPPVPNNRTFEETPQKNVPSLPFSFERQYHGRSDRPLTLSLTKNGSSLTGTAATPGDIDYLDGTIRPDGTFDLAGNNRGNGITGHWRGRIEPDGSIRGVWTANNGRRVSYSAH